MEEAPANKAREDQRRTNQADGGIELPAALEPCGGFGRGHLVDAVHGGEDRRVPVVRAQVREHVVLEDPLAFAVGQERGGETGRRVELDLSARTARLEVEEDREAVVEPLAADAPLVDQRLGLPLGLLGGGVADLCVDHDLGLRPLFDSIDGLLDGSDRLGLEHAGEVVDGAVDLRFGERWSRRWRIGGMEGCRDCDQPQRDERDKSDPGDGVA